MDSKKEQGYINCIWSCCQSSHLRPLNLIILNYTIYAIYSIILLILFSTIIQYDKQYDLIESDYNSNIKAMMEEQQHQSCSKRIQNWFIDLTNALLNSYKISNMTYLVIKILQFMQITYFMMRVQGNNYHWNFSFISYISIFINYTVVDSNLRLYPIAYGPLLYMITIILILLLGLGVLIGVHAGWGKKMPLYIKILMPIVNIMVCLFKSILVIPALQLIFICFSPSATQILNLTISNGLRLGLGMIILLTFLMLKFYILIFYRECNPFSQIQHAGQSIYRGGLTFIIKFIFSLYSILDLDGKLEFTADVLVTIILFLYILEGHYQIGLYKEFPRKLQFKLMYFTFSISILQTMDYYSTGTYISFTFLIPYFFFAHMISDSILNWQKKKSILINLVQNKSPERLEEHVLNLILLIDSIERRENRILLEGYLHIHHRQCRNGEQCPCQLLINVRQRNQQQIKITYFKLIVTILNDGRKKYPNYRNIDLLLGLVYHFRIKNPLQAIYAFAKLISAHKESLINRLYVSYYLQRVEEEMIEIDQKEISRTSNINKYLEYTNKMVSFQEHVESCTMHHVEFWRLMLDSNPEIKRLEDLGTLITRNKDYLKDQFESIFQNNPNSINLLIIYGKFLLEVTNEQSYNVKYLEKADVIYKNIKYSSKIDEAGSKYNQNAQTGVIVISGNDGELGIIVHTNNLVRKLLGYKRSEILDRSVETIMPKIYADNHNATLSRYIGASQSKVNGHERIVPALSKDGFILPVSALTKALPDLTKGIMIVGFLSKMEESDLKEEQEQNLKQINYMLYRTDTQQILGISQGCSKDYHIDPSLIYGNPNNMNNQLKIKHLFDVSFQRSEQGKIAAALDVGQVEMIICTKKLKNQFIISKTSSKENLIDVDQQDSSKGGVEIQVIARNILTSIYYGVTLKLISIHPKQYPKPRESAIMLKTSKKSQMRHSKRQVHDPEENIKTDNDDFKNLKDFKNFISLKSQPSAITALSGICLFFVLLVCSSTIGLIVNWNNIIQINQNMMNLSRLTLFSQLALPQMTMQTQKSIIALSSSLWNITGFTPYASSSAKLSLIVRLLKNWQLSILPYKYSFNPNYNDLTTEYSLLSTGKITKNQYLIQEVINNYISQIETISMTNISSLANFTTNLQSNIYQKYSSAKMNQLYSLRTALNASNSIEQTWYQNSISTTKIIIISVSSLMIAGIILWLVLLLPYVLSVTKINNRVLSLFSLIPYGQICKLIYGCLQYLNRNLSEANINMDDLKYYQIEQNTKQNFIQAINSPSNPNSPLGLSNNSFTQTNMIRRTSDLNKGGKDSVMVIEQKFQKMKNSEDRNKKIVIIKFLIISFIILIFVLFYLFYSLTLLTQTSTIISNYQLLGRRPSLIRNTKLLITQYLINPQYNPLSTSIKTLNLNMINQFYNLESNLLYIDLGNSQAQFNGYNNGDVCSYISAYSTYSIFGEEFNTSQCYAARSQILQKGVKTGIVDVLQNIRSILSMYTTSVPRSILSSNVLIFDSMTKYIETPMLAILSKLNQNLTNSLNTSQTIILLTGGIFLIILIFCWRVFWTRYLSELNIKIWRTKGLLNLIPMRIITTNDLLKNQFTSGQLQNAVR